MDEDDKPGYLMDYIESWIQSHDIETLDDFDSLFQTDSFQEELNEFAENIIRGCIE